MDNDDTAPTKRQIFACCFTLCRAVAKIGNGSGSLDPEVEADIGKKYADELMKQEPR